MNTPEAGNNSSIRTLRPRRAATPTTGGSLSMTGTPLLQLEGSRSRDGASADLWAIATTWSYSAENNSIVLKIGDSGEDTADKGRILTAVSNDDLIEERYGSVAEVSVGQSIAFQGIVDMCVLSGAASVYGYTATPECGWMRVYSPSSHPLVQITSAPSKSSSIGSRSASNRASDANDDLHQIQRIWSEFKDANSKREKRDGPTSSIAFRAVKCGLEEVGVAAPPYRGLFVPKPFEERAGSVVSKRNAKRKVAFSRNSPASKLARGSKTGYDGAMSDDDYSDTDRNEEYAESAKEHGMAERFLVNSIGLPGFYPILFLTNDQQLLMAPHDWVEKLDMASSAPLQLDEEFEPISPRYVISGGQSQGKSTFSRFLLNRLLNRYGRLFYMETDLGQSELSPPGALSVTLLSEPLLGPPFTHVSQIEPYHAIYMGTTSPKGDPDRYVAAIRCLSGTVQEYVNSTRSKSTSQGATAAALDGQVVPVVVNTHGWLKGLGLDLHYSLCEVVRPTTYIQLYGPAAHAGNGPAGSEEQRCPDGSDSGQIAPIIDFSSISACNPQLVWVSAMTPERAAQMLHRRQSAIAADNQVSDDEYESQQEESSEYAIEPQKAAHLTTYMEATGAKNPWRAAQDMRVLALVSHFYCSGGLVHLQSTGFPSRRLKSMSWDMRLPLAARRPLLVPLSELVFWLGTEDIPPSQLLRALNGTIVGVIATSIAHTPGGRTWTTDAIHDLFAEDKSVRDSAVSQLSEPGSRLLLRARMVSHRGNYVEDKLSLCNMPQIVYGHPNMEKTTVICHALVRSVDPINGNVQLLLPPLATAALEPSEAFTGSPNLLHRIVGLHKGPGPSELGVELPVWSMVDGGYSKRAMGSSSARPQGRYGQNHFGSNLGIQEAPYLSVETDEGIGASATRSRGGQMRRALK